LSIPENNFTLPAAFKNTLDWISRADGDYTKTWRFKVLFVAGASPIPENMAGPSIFAVDTANKYW
jgi:NAD(P)H-dependent FMN reductase